MKPKTSGEFSDRESRKNLTPRQIQRRRRTSSYDADDRTPESIQIGKSSKAYKDNGRYVFDLSEEDLSNLTSFDIDKYINIFKSPILNKLSSNPDSIYSTRPAKRNMYHIAVFMNNIGHYSGGRYYLIWIVHMLANMGHKVTVISDNTPFFLNDFKYVDVGDRIEWVTEERCLKTNWFLKSDENPFDILINTPVICAGFSYAFKWNVPLYSILFESPNFVRKYRTGSDSLDEYWTPYKNGIQYYSKELICISNEALGEAKEWLNEWERSSYSLVQPCINTYVADRIEEEEENAVLFVGRHVDFKNTTDIILAISKIDERVRPKINFVGAHSEKCRRNMVDTANKLGVEIHFFAKVNDEEKFTIIKRSKLMCFPTSFEGFGMPPAEAIYCKKPVITYDLPVLRKEYGDAIDYVPVGDIDAMANKIEEYLVGDYDRMERGWKCYHKFFDKKNPVPCLPEYMKRKLRKTFYGNGDLSITAGIIVLNGEDTIRKAIGSIYEAVDKIVIVEGVVEDFAKANPEMHKGGHSIDNTLKIIEEYPDNLNKILLVVKTDGKYWKNKNEMQNAIATLVDTDLYLKVDADEIFLESDIEYMKRMFMADSSLYVVQILKHEFWRGLEMVSCGGIWDRPQARMWRWDKSFRHPMDTKTGFNYFIDDDGMQVKSPNYKVMNLMEKLCYHLGYARTPEQIQAKIKYYKSRGIEKSVVDNYTDWQPGMPTNSTNPEGTTAKRFEGELPLILRDWYNDTIKVSTKEKEENNINIMESRPLKPAQRK